MVYSYLLDREILPDELAEKYGRFNTEDGSDWALFPTSAADYGLTIEMRTFNWKDVIAALEEGKVIIANAHKDTVFTDGGHYIVFYGITPEGKVLVKDPSIYNYGQWNGPMKEGFAEGFDQKYVKYGCFPCWIFAPKDIEAVSAQNSNLDV